MKFPNDSFKIWEMNNLNFNICVSLTRTSLPVLTFRAQRSISATGI
jgi:hypothetical protein